MLGLIILLIMGVFSFLVTALGVWLICFVLGVFGIVVLFSWKLVLIVWVVAMLIKAFIL